MNARVWRALLAAVFIAMLAGCKHTPVQPSRPGEPPSRAASRADAPAQELRDGGPVVPPDVSRIPEPVPRAEPRAAYGNKSPYTVLGRTYRLLPSGKGYRERGMASWYGTKFHGRLTSSREPYDMYKFTAAHKTLPLPAFARVTHLDNGRSIIVRVNDRGPFHDGRIIDLSYAAAVKLGLHVRGTAPVEVEVLEPGGRTLARATRRNETGAARSVLLQVGAFSDPDNARRLEDRLEAAEIDAVHRDRERVNGQVVHRVRIGPLRSDKANAAIARLRELGFPNVTVAVDRPR